MRFFRMRSLIVACSTSVAILVRLHFLGLAGAEEILNPIASSGSGHSSTFVNESASLSEAFLNCASRCTLNKDCIGITLFKYIEDRYSSTVNSYFCSIDLNATFPQEMDNKNSTVVYKLMFRNRLKKVVRRPVVVLGRPRRQALFPAEHMLNELNKIRSDSSNSSIAPDSSSKTGPLFDSSTNSNSTDIPRQDENVPQIFPQSQGDQKFSQNEDGSKGAEAVGHETNHESGDSSGAKSTLASIPETGNKNVIQTDKPASQIGADIASIENSSSTEEPIHDSGVSIEETSTLAGEIGIMNVKQTGSQMSRTNPSQERDEEVDELIKELENSRQSNSAQSSTPSLEPIPSNVLITEISQESLTSPNFEGNRLTSQTPASSNDILTNIHVDSTVVPSISQAPIESSVETTTTVSLSSFGPITEIPKETVTNPDMEVPPLSSQAPPASNKLSAGIPEKAVTTPQPVKHPVMSEIALQSSVASTEIPEVTKLFPGLTLNPATVTTQVPITLINFSTEMPQVMKNTLDNSETPIFSTEPIEITGSSTENKIDSTSFPLEEFIPTTLPGEIQIGKPTSNKIVRKNDTQPSSTDTAALPTNNPGTAGPTSATSFLINISESDIFDTTTEMFPTGLAGYVELTIPFLLNVTESDIFETATDRVSTKILGIIRPTPHYPTNVSESYIIKTTNTKQLVDTFDTDSRECYFEDREMFRRNILAGSYAILDEEPVLLTFVERSSCVATFSKNGHHGVFNMKNLLPGFPLQQVEAASFINDTLYLLDSNLGEDQAVHGFKYDAKVGIYGKASPAILTRSDFLSKHCGILLPATVTVKALAQLHPNAGNSCIILDKTRIPIVSIAASKEVKSLARAINYVLEIEFVPYAEAVFTWLDESLTTVYVFGSNGELYALTRDLSRRRDHWKYRVVPYSQFPV